MALKHLKKIIRKLLKVKITQKTILLKLTNYYNPQKEQSLLLQINLPAYPVPPITNRFASSNFQTTLSSRTTSPYTTYIQGKTTHTATTTGHFIRSLPTYTDTYTPDV
jgi:hypothetical protein